MHSKVRLWLPALALLGLCSSALAQEKTPVLTPPQTKLPPAPARTAVAAKVNGKPIPEIAVYRVLSKEVPVVKWKEARPEILSFLIETALIDQYLERLKPGFVVTEKEVQDKIQQLKSELKKVNQDYDKMLTSLNMTEGELKEQITGALRWDKFVDKYGTEVALRDLFDKNKAMFDGSMVRARHILIKPKQNTKEAGEQARAQALALKKQIEAGVAQEVAKVTATDKLVRAKARMEALEKTFGAVAAKESDCPSKKQGGDLGRFTRMGMMVEPFAQAAFALEPYQISEPVATEFGYHLIMPTERVAGKDVKYDTPLVKGHVREVYAERLREAVLTQMRPVSKIDVLPAAQ